MVNEYNLNVHHIELWDDVLMHHIYFSLVGCWEKSPSSLKSILCKTEQSSAEDIIIYSLE